MPNFTKIVVSSITIFSLLLTFAVNASAATYKFCGFDSQGNQMLCPETVGQQYYSSEAVTEGIACDSSAGECNEVITQTCSGVICNLTQSMSEAMNGAITVQTNGADSPTETGQFRIGIEQGLTGAFLDGTKNLYLAQPIEPASVYAQRNFNNVVARLNIVEDVQAQDSPQDSTVYFPGLGYQILQPIQGFWNMNRNIAYGLLIVVVFIIALLILFRREINGKDTITLLNSLPSIIFSLLFISFSYPIAGLFIDVITVGANFTQAVLVSTPGSPGYNTVWQSIRNDNKLGCNTAQAAGAVSDAAGSFFQSPTTTVEPEQLNGKTAVQIDDRYMSVWMIFGTANICLNDSLGAGTDDQGLNLLPSDVLQAAGPLQGIVNSIGTVFQGNPQGEGQQDPISGVRGATNTVTTNILNIIFAFAALSAAVRIFFSVLNAFLTLILFPMLLPYIGLIAALPSMTSQMISLTIRTLLAPALTIVAIYAAFLTIVVITYEPLLATFNFLPPLLGYESTSSLSADGGLIQILIGYGLFLLVPTIPEQINKSLQAAEAGAFGKEITDSTKKAASQILSLGRGLAGGATGSLFPNG